ncbi:aminotransferase class V-fold PLP-dependent enzyme [Pseudomonas aeruginosa]
MSALFPAAPDAFGADELLRLRRETPAWGSYAHFAHGSASLPPQVLYDALDSWLEAERRWGVQRAAEHFAEPLLAVRDSVARVLGTQPRHIALLDCASRAWSVAFAAALAAHPRIRAISSFDEYGSNSLCLLAARQQRGLELRLIDARGDAAQLLQRLDEQLHDLAPGQTPLLSLSAVPTGHGAATALEGVAERIRAHDGLLFLDASHAVGQAAIELQVICELEKQRRKLDLDYASSPAFLTDLRDYQPSTALEKAELQTHSTSKGADYGVTSPMTQFQVYRNAIQARQKLGLFHEVEWVQHVRSYAMTRFAVEHPRLRLGGSGQLNVILLFGFSPRLPFPETYQQFRAVIESAKSLEYDIGEPGVRKRKVSITVGAAVMPQHAAQHFRPLDVGPRAGTPLCALRRLAAYAAQADSQVDVLRVGMEDTPYAVDDDGQVTLSDNCQLLRQALDELRANGAEAELDGERIFQRMGMERTLGEYLSLQRLHPLGEANFTLAREFVQ